MLRCVGFYKKFCQSLSIPLDYTLETTKDTFLLKFQEVKTMGRILIKGRQILSLSVCLFLLPISNKKGENGKEDLQGYSCHTSSANFLG